MNLEYIALNAVRHLASGGNTSFDAVHRRERIAQRWSIVRTRGGTYELESDCRWSDAHSQWIHEHYAVECEHCSEILEEDDLRDVRTSDFRGRLSVSNWCENCRDNGAGMCHGCDEMWADDSLNCTNAGSFCASCEQEQSERSTLPEYHRGFRITLPYGDDRRKSYYSAELEIEATDRDGLLASLETIANNQATRWLGWERDGSLNESRGVELLISMRPSLTELLASIKSLLPTIRAHGGTSWDNGRCGLHVNSNCTHWPRMRRMRLLYLVHALRPVLERISGRAGAHWCSWPVPEYSRSSPAYWWTNGLLCRWERGELGKYLCVRAGADRMEWRMFRGSLRPSRLAMYLETVRIIEEASSFPVHRAQVEQVRANLAAMAASFGFSVL